jgi:ferredoxin
VADVYCDGLGACLGECPRDAITIVEREADPFDETVAIPSKASDEKSTPRPACNACPGTAVRDLRLNVLPASGLAGPALPKTSADASPAALSHWPIQLHLVPVHAPFLRGADLVLVADCVPFACADFHSRILQGRPVVIGCPKLDDARAYAAKLAEILAGSHVKSLRVVHMEVPCCTGLVRIASEAMRISSADVPLTEITVTIDGKILAERAV